MQPFGGTRQVLLVGDGDEGAKLDQVDEHCSEIQNTASRKKPWIVPPPVPRLYPTQDAGHAMSGADQRGDRMERSAPKSRAMSEAGPAAADVALRQTVGATRAGMPSQDATATAAAPAPDTAHGVDDDYAAHLAAFACGIDGAALDPRVVRAVKTNLFDTLACAAAGSNAAGVAELRGLATEWGGARQATVLAFGDRLPAHHAAWINGTMAHARDYDDTHDAAVLHAGVSVVPAALAAAELAGAVPGSELIAAVAAGLETICRLGVATRISIIDSGYMYTSLFGHFAATVAAGRILRLTRQQMIDAIGICYSQVAGNHQVTRDGALTKRMQPGFAAQAALVSVQLARRGVRGTQATFDGIDGFLRVYLHGACDAAALRNGLGQRYEFENLSYKPYPCCRLNHTGIDAALALRATAAIDADAIESIRIGINHQAYQAVCTPPAVRKAPQSTVHAQFSLPYTVAAALIDGAVRIGHFDRASFERADLLALARRVEPYVDDEIERAWGRSISPAALEVRMRDGAVHRHRIDYPSGHPQRPMTPHAVQVKAADCFQVAAVPFAQDAAARLAALVDGIEAMDDVAALVAAMAPGGQAVA
jgi:2-methylcitrate dehydratase PrpD